MSGSNTRPLVLETTALPAELIPYKLAPRDGFEPPKSRALTVPWHTTCRPWNKSNTRSWSRTKVISACKADAIDQLGESSEALSDKV